MVVVVFPEVSCLVIYCHYILCFQRAVCGWRSCMVLKNERQSAEIEGERERKNIDGTDFFFSEVSHLVNYCLFNLHFHRALLG